MLQSETIREAIEFIMKAVTRRAWSMSWQIIRGIVNAPRIAGRIFRKESKLIIGSFTYPQMGIIADRPKPRFRLKIHPIGIRLLIHPEKEGKFMAKSEILLLGDGSQSFRTMSWVLEYKGFSIKAVRGPEAALEALVKKNYDLIIAKVSRNERDSLTALRQARKINPLTKVMLVTNSLDLAFPLEAYGTDIDDYIIMPISAGEFWRRVENCLEDLVIDLTAEDSPSQSASEEKLAHNFLACDLMVSATGPEIITAF